MTKKETKNETKVPAGYMPKLQALYKEKVLPALLKDMNVKSPMAVPKMTKIVINIGVKEAREDIKALETAKADLTAIAGQAAQVRRAKKSISNFKLREGMPIGVRVTLRGARMYEFMERFICIACHTAIQLDSCRCQCHLCTAADAAANQRVNTVFRQETCQCTVTAAVGRNNSSVLHRAVLYIVNLKCFRVSEVLKNLSVFIRYCDSHCLSPFLRQYCLCLLPCSARASPAAAIFLTQLIRPARNAQSIITHSCRSVKQLAVPNPQQKRWQP